MKTIGILGGLGPNITAKLYLEIVNFKKFKKYPNVLISNVSFLRGLDEKIIQNKESISCMINPLIKSIRQLIKSEVEIFVLPCNTLEELIPKIKDETGVKLLTPVEEVVRRLSRMKIKKLGMIATSKTKDLNIYENRLKNIEIVYPSKKDQKEISCVISRIITNKTRMSDKEFLEKLIKRFKMIGCDKVVLGCTDLSDIIDKSPFVIDSFSVLSRKIKDILLNS